MGNGDTDTEKLYFDWLYNTVCPELGGRPKYRKVCEHMHHVIFDWGVPNDDNRAAEGKELRYEFFEAVRLRRGALRPPIYRSKNRGGLSAPSAILQEGQRPGGRAPDRWALHENINIGVPRITCKRLE